MFEEVILRDPPVGYSFFHLARWNPPEHQAVLDTITSATRGSAIRGSTRVSGRSPCCWGDNPGHRFVALQCCFMASRFTFQ